MLYECTCMICGKNALDQWADQYDDSGELGICIECRVIYGANNSNNYERSIVKLGRMILEDPDILYSL